MSAPSDLLSPINRWAECVLEYFEPYGFRFQAGIGTFFSVVMFVRCFCRSKVSKAQWTDLNIPCQSLASNLVFMGSLLSHQMPQIGCLWWFSEPKTVSFIPLNTPLNVGVLLSSFVLIIFNDIFLYISLIIIFSIYIYESTKYFHY